MTPHISILFSCEMLRDGGTLCLSFQDPEGLKWWLLSHPKSEGVGYDSPYLSRRDLELEIPLNWSDVDSYCGVAKSRVYKDLRPATEYHESRLKSTACWVDTLAFVSEKFGSVSLEDVTEMGFAWLYSDENA